jgi:hypothetical protein
VFVNSRGALLLPGDIDSGRHRKAERLAPSGEALGALRPGSTGAAARSAQPPNSGVPLSERASPRFTGPALRGRAAGLRLARTPSCWRSPSRARRRRSPTAAHATIPPPRPMRDGPSASMNRSARAFDGHLKASRQTAASRHIRQRACGRIECPSGVGSTSKPHGSDCCLAWKHQRSSRERMLATVLVGRPRLTALNADFAPEAVVCGLARSSTVASV